MIEKYKFGLKEKKTGKYKLISFTETFWVVPVLMGLKTPILYPS